MLKTEGAPNLYCLKLNPNYSQIAVKPFTDTVNFLFKYGRTLKERGVSRGKNMRDRHLNSWDSWVLIF